MYEALTGKTAYLGETVTDTLAKIVEREPDWEQLPSVTPSSIRRLLRRCFQKDTQRRIHDMADARIEIEEAIAEPSLPEETRSVFREPRDGGRATMDHRSARGWACHLGFYQWPHLDQRHRSLSLATPPYS